ncbi:hypothetical protein TanjilG_04782 [Lupinus angustifolius]|uniref:Uncharacterized protein n=1 Tax=Lupinus angustifolius TaxID=3871 RepID=A0A4P1RKN5_LUPAN|nr:hypothetical protein TanjilG_04782 [Lupinus angustifolius]
MVPITTYFFIFISAFYFFWDARLVIEEDVLLHNHLLFPFSTMGSGLAHPDLPIFI